MNRLIPILLGVLALATTGCTSFDREWWRWQTPHGPETHVFSRKTLATPTKQSLYDGRWAGRWTSDRHTKLFSKEPASGDVRLVLTHIDAYRYRAHFRAHWMAFRDDYLTELYGRERKKTFRFKGTQSLSPLVGGDYHYEGTVTPTRFEMRYNSRYDSGTIELTPVQ